MQGIVALVIFLTIGLFAQLIDGTVGMGYGAFSATFLIGIGIMPALASASIHTAEVFTTLISGVSHWGFGNVKKDWLLLLAVPGCVGGAAGAYFLSSVPGDVMKSFIALFLMALGIVIVFGFSKRKQTVDSDPRCPWLPCLPTAHPATGSVRWGLWRRFSMPLVVAVGVPLPPRD